MKAPHLLIVTAATVLAGCASSPAVEPPVASVAAPALQGGSSWVYDQINPYNGTRVRTITYTLAARSGGFELVGRSDRSEDPAETETVSAPWQISAQSGGAARRAFDPPLSAIRFPVAPGERWRQTLHMTNERGETQRWTTTARAARWERVKTPAGEFVALRIERQMNLGDRDAGWGDTMVFDVFWYVPEVRRWVRLERRLERRESVKDPRVDRDWIVWQLSSYRLPG